jgi:imidazolonepropionase-like amidohydrolase
MPSRFVLFALPLALASCASPAGAPASSGDGGIVIEDVTLVSPERPAPMEHADVVVRDGRIVQVGTGLAGSSRARRIDGRGRFLVPGLIDSHVHLGSQGPLDAAAMEAHPELLRAYRAQLGRDYLAFGFTTVIDLDLRPETRAWFDTAPVHPRLYSCGPAVRIAGGYGAQQVSGDPTKAGNLVYEPGRQESWPRTLDPTDYTPASAVDRVVAAGGVCVKTFVEPGFGGALDWPVPRPATLAALHAEAHGRGLVLVVHANAVQAWRAALDAQADVIAHGLWHWPGDRMSASPPQEAADVIEGAARAGIGVQPTLQAVYGDQSIFDETLLDNPRLAESLPRALIAYLHDDEARAARRATADEYRGAIAGFFGPAAPDPATAMSVAPARATNTLRVMLDRKVRLLLGTDTPSNEGIGNPPGLNGRFEVQRWFEAGVPLPRILRAATLDNATAFGLSRELGSIEVGKRADLLLLRADPLRTVAAYDAIETVFLDGTPIERDSLLPAN